MLNLDFYKETWNRPLSVVDRYKYFFLGIFHWFEVDLNTAIHSSHSSLIYSIVWVQDSSTSVYLDTQPKVRSGINEGNHDTTNKKVQGEFVDQTREITAMTRLKQSSTQ